MRTPCFVFLTFLVAMSFCAEAQDDQPVKLKPSRETTYFTGPLNKAGTLDYIAALNKYHGEGIAPEDNAFTLLLQMMPREFTSTDHQKKHLEVSYKALGIEPDPDVQAFLSWSDYAEDRGIEPDDADLMYDKAISEPWTPEQLPLIESWLEQNDPLIPLLKEAFGRKHYFAPLIRAFDDTPLDRVLLPQLGSVRRLSKMLVIRAQRSIANGDDQAVVDEMNLLLRIGQAVSNEPFMIGKLTGISIHALQSGIVETIAERGSLGHEAAFRYLREQNMSGSIDSMQSGLLELDRCILLDILQRANTSQRTGLKFFFTDLEDDEPGPNALLVEQFLEEIAQSKFFDINRGLSKINSTFDQYQKLIEKGDYRTMQEDIDALDDSLRGDRFKPLAFQISLISRTEKLPEGWDMERYTDSVADLFASKLIYFGRAMSTENRSNTRRDVESVVIALLGYRDKHGELPETLEALVPAFLKEVPIDFATGDPLIYRIEPDGTAVVYSLGDNLKDDGGIDDFDKGDIAIRIGVPKT